MLGEFEYLSRNRYFDLYAGQEGYRRLLSLRLIQSLHHDLLKCIKCHFPISLKNQGNDIELKFRVRYREQPVERRTLLHRQEYRFLKGIAELRPHFEQAEKENPNFLFH